VIATLTGCSEEVIIPDTTHTFTSNGDFTFTFTDAAGNAGSAFSTVDYIDKTAPSLTDVTTSTQAPTSGDVILTVLGASDGQS